MQYTKPILLTGALLVVSMTLLYVQSAPVPEQKTGSASLFTGRWKNQRGSTLELKEIDGQVQGYFTTAVAKTKSCIGQPLAIQGSTNKNALSLNLSMASCGSPAVVAITGILTKNKKSGEEQLKTQAVVQFNGEETWDSQILTTDYFTRVSSKIINKL